MIKKMFNRKGITLLELLTVVVLIGIVASLAAANYDNAITKIRHKSTVRGLLGKMRMARSDAISKAGRYGIYINTANDYYIFFRNMANDTTYDAGTDSVKDSTELSSNISFGSCTFDSCPAVFKGDGSAMQSGYIEVVNDKNSKTTRINVTAAVGRVYLSE